MQITKELMYLEKEDDSILPVPMDQVVIIRNIGNVEYSSVYFLTEDEIDMEYDKSPLNSVKQLLLKEGMLRGWIETQGQKDDRLYNPVYINIDSTINSNINIRGRECVVILCNPETKKPVDKDYIDYPQYLQLMKALNISNPWTEINKNSTVIREFLEEVKVILTQTNNETFGKMIYPYLQWNKPGDTWELQVCFERGAVQVEDVLSVWEQLGVIYHKERVWIRNRSYIAYIAGKDDFNSLCRKIAGKRQAENGKGERGG